MINVLSLFDGISAGQLALQRLGIEVNNFYSSEISKNAIKVTQHHFPNTIHLGDIRDIKAADLPKIDLMMGGSPCQGFSRQGKKLNFDDPRSQLFFEYLRLLREVKPTYFFLENVIMDKHCETLISEELEVPSISINSELVSAQSRDRLYWTNIPYYGLPKDQNIYIKDIIETNISQQDEKYARTLSEGILKKLRKERYRIKSLNSKKPTILCSEGTFNITVIEDNGYRKLTITELERCQIFPDGYTSMIKGHRARHFLLGNSWTVDIIVWFFSFLPYHIKNQEVLQRLRDNYQDITEYMI